MDESKLNRALNWVGGGGTVLAVSALLTAGLFAATPDGESPAAHLSPCFTAGCTAAPSTTTTVGRKVVHHHGRVTYPETRGVNQTVAAPAATPAPPAAPAPHPNTWTTSLPAQHLDAAIVGMAFVGKSSLVMVGADGGVFDVGQAGYAGSLSGKSLSERITAVAPDPIGGGYWLAARDGGVFAFDAAYHGSLSGKHLSSPVVAMAATPSGRGYWLVSQDGGVFAFGDAPYRGSLSGKHLSSPVVAMAATPSGRGYWLVSQDGGVFAFGDAPYVGSLSGKRLSAPVMGMAATHSGRGYWLASRDGGVFAFGDAHYYGNSSGSGFSAIVATSTGKGYWLSDSHGRVHALGDAHPVVVQNPQPTVVATAADLPAPAPAPAPAAPRPAARPARAHPAAGPSFAPVTDVRGPDRYRSGSLGYDISQYQCGGFPAGRRGVAVVQVTGGAINNQPNPCYVEESRWAGPNMSAYIYMDGLPNPVPGLALSGAAGRCTVTQIACASYNYGFLYARHWVTYSNSVGVHPRMWWLDVEKYSGWRDAGSNVWLIQGALDGLKSEHVRAGIYSSAPQWQEITGGMPIRGVPLWVPGAGTLTGAGYTATNFCAAPGSYAFGGGRLEIVQYGYSGPFPGSYPGPVSYDLDFAC